MAHPEQVKKAAVAMRRKGASYTDIMTKLDLSKSTTKYMVRGVRLTKAQKKALSKRRPKTHVLTEDGRQRIKEAASYHSKKRWRQSRSKQLAATRESLEKAHLTYRKDELETKRQMEHLFGRAFKKERIGNRIMDFADDEFLIEHSTHALRGIDDMTARFQDVVDDPRRKIAFVADEKGKFGAKRRARLQAVVDEIRDIKELRGLV